ncbi:uncharacterized protein L199_006842 [Kwoniella botswanensis]|uniref:uncharacterized protein n=1 Tax=Kwoniella botswanensis TaxID=1268659 RepID=UPI00315DD881
MVEQADRTRPRALTADQLRACWRLLGDDEEKERSLGRTLQMEELLPQVAKNDKSWTLSAIPTTYPILRTSYDICSTAQIIERQSMRTFKLSILRDIVTGVYQDYHGTVKHQRFKGMLTSWLGEDRVELPDFEVCLTDAVTKKDQGNDLFRKGNYIRALGIYVEAWGCLIPYHIHAFPTSDTNVLLYGNLESRLFNNMLISLIKWCETDSLLNESSKYALWGLSLSCGQIATEPIQAATFDVGTFLKACQRIICVSNKLKDYPDHPLKGHYALEPKMIEHFEFFIDHLKNAPSY